MHAQATIGFGFTSDWLKKWRENFEPITEWSDAQPKQFADYFRHSIENRSKCKDHFYLFRHDAFCAQTRMLMALEQNLNNGVRK